MSSDDQSDKECPLCMEAFDIDDINFFPCNCQYQICRFCWHRIRTNENGLCPACRQSYPEDPVNFQPLSSAELQKIKTEKKQKIQREKNKLIEGRRHLAEFRVLQKNLVYAVGLSQRMADPELLKKPEFFGKFGKIIKVAVGTAQAINNNTPPTHTAYVTYARSEDALRAINAVNNMIVDGRLLKASLGTTKYCSNFLKGQACYKPECMYLHEVAEEEISFTKEDMHQGRHTEYERRLHEQMINVSVTHGINQQNSSNSLKDVILKSRTNHRTTEQSEKKRPVTTGSAENLTKITQQKQKKLVNPSTAGTSKVAGWNDKKNCRGGSETRELRRNESAKAIVTTETKRNSKASLKSVSPQMFSNDDSPSTRTRRDVGESNDSNNSNMDPRNTSPVSMSSSIGETLGTAGDVLCSRSDSNPTQIETLASSLSPPISAHSHMPNTEAIELTNGTAALDEATVNTCNGQLLSDTESQVETHPQPYNSSSLHLHSDHDDDLGFDPFIESSKGLEQMIEEEKHFTPPSNRTNCYNSTSSTLFNQQQIPPPGLHQPYGGPDGADPFQTCGFDGMFNNKIHAGSNGNLSMTDLRESFKAMLPNVNVHFISDSNKEGHQQQPIYDNQATAPPPIYYGAGSNSGTASGGGDNYFGAISNNLSTSSLPSLPSSHASSRTTMVPQSIHYRPFLMEQQHLQQQRNFHQHQQQQASHAFHHHQQQAIGAGGGQDPSQMGNFNNMAAKTTETNGPFSSHKIGQQPAHPQQQHSPHQSPYQTNSSSQQAAVSPAQQHHFNMLPHQYNYHMPQQQMGGARAGQFQIPPDQQQQSSSNSVGGWLPVPPGFSPRMGN